MDPAYAQFMEKYGPLGLVLIAVITGMLVPRPGHEALVTLYREQNSDLRQQSGTLKDQVADLIRQRDEITRDRDRIQTMFDTVSKSAEAALQALGRQGAGDDR